MRKASLTIQEAIKRLDKGESTQQVFGTKKALVGKWSCHTCKITEPSLKGYLIHVLVKHNFVPTEGITLVEHNKENWIRFEERTEKQQRIRRAETVFEQLKNAASFVPMSPFKSSSWKTVEGIMKTIFDKGWATDRQLQALTNILIAYQKCR